MFCNKLIPHFSAKFFKPQILGDMLKHLDPESKLQKATQIYFLQHSIEMINDHLTYQDEELALNLMNSLDILKNCDDQQVSDAAFEVDDRMKFNIGAMPSFKKKAFQRLEMIKLQREKRLGVRE